jgi:FHS family L-fucose permease-like MFS transporter
MIPSPAKGSAKKYTTPVILVISLFFLWALPSNLLPILIPHLKKACKLNVFQSSFVDSAYWIAYFTIAIPAGYVAKKFSYKITIIVGLLLAAAGAFLFFPAAESRIYAFFLVALFMVASGMTFLETSANPYMTVLGDPATGAQRLNFAQAFNGLGAVIASMFLSKLIITPHDVKTDDELKVMSPTDIDSYYSTLFHNVKLPYMLLGTLLLIAALMFLLTKFPSQAKSGKPFTLKLDVSRYPNLVWGIVAQFFYVGAQVCVSSFFILYTEKAGGMSQYEATTYYAFLLLPFAAGRYVGTFLMKYVAPQRLLMFYALANILLMTIIVFVGGRISIFTFYGVEFFMSIMFPTIFSLAIKDLGEKTEVASSYVVMAILGGAFFPPLLGRITDATGNIQMGYLIPLLCFIPVFYYGWKGHRVKVVQEDVIEKVGYNV